MNILNKKFGIFGLGITGEACFKYLQDRGSIAICFDEKPSSREYFAQNFSAQYLVDLNNDAWQKLDYIIASPGVALRYPLKHKLAQIADEYGIELICDVDILFAQRKDSKFIGITGTNGKSTTCSLLQHLLSEEGFLLGGNIGKACLSLESSPGYVIELSSYQLDLLKDFKPNFASITNITPDHLDRYPSMQEYTASKFGIAKNMDLSDHLIINLDDEILKSARDNFANTNLVTISLKSADAEIFYRNGAIVDTLNNQTHSFTLPKTLQGEHNLYNILVAYAIATKLGLKGETILQKITSFPGIKHRMEFVESKGAISFYNDSKATNAEATSNALKALDNIFWLAGGIPKEGGIVSIAALMSRVKKAYFFGQAAAQFASQVEVDSLVFDTLQQAFTHAFSDAQKLGANCNILLSPACASFDQYKNFEERGEEFIKMVKKII
jgi:UDP-N-acetylmuramoylalanine--D-glutamate ligase